MLSYSILAQVMRLVELKVNLCSLLEVSNSLRCIDSANRWRTSGLILIKLVHFFKICILEFFSVLLVLSIAIFIISITLLIMQINQVLILINRLHVSSIIDILVRVVGSKVRILLILTLHLSHILYSRCLAYLLKSLLSWHLIYYLSSPSLLL